MEYLYVVLMRLLHVGVGAFWVGSSIYLAVFILPAIQAAGPEGGKVMGILPKTRHLPFVMDTVTAITIVTGALLYFKLSSGLQTEWITSRYGMSLTLGGLSALAAYIIGFVVNRPTVARMNKIGAAAAQAGGPPSPQQMTELMALRARLTMAINVIAALLTFSVAAMGVARYL